MCGAGRCHPLTIATLGVFFPRLKRLKPVVTAIGLPFLPIHDFQFPPPHHGCPAQKMQARNTVAEGSCPGIPGVRVSPPNLPPSQGRPSARSAPNTPSSLIPQNLIFIADPATTFQSSGPLLVVALPSHLPFLNNPCYAAFSDDALKEKNKRKISNPCISERLERDSQGRGDSSRSGPKFQFI